MDAAPIVDIMQNAIAVKDEKFGVMVRSAVNMGTLVCILQTHARGAAADLGTHAISRILVDLSDALGQTHEELAEALRIADAMQDAAHQGARA